MPFCTCSSMIQILDAANYTKSHIMFYWWTPDYTLQKYSGTDFDFVQVFLPRPTSTCTKNRVTQVERCSSAPMYGSPEGSCDSEVLALKKLIVNNLYHNTIEDVPEALQSPAYFSLQNMKISELDIEDMFQDWLKTDNDRFSYGYRESIW